MGDTLARVDAGEEDPPCEVCGGILKSDTISFGQQLVPEVIDPWAWLGGGTGAAGAHAIAGAAASLSGSLR